MPVVAGDGGEECPGGWGVHVVDGRWQEQASVYAAMELPSTAVMTSTDHHYYYYYYYYYYKHAYAGTTDSLPHVRVLLVLTERGILAQSN
jgi:hypothetical protein